VDGTEYGISPEPTDEDRLVVVAAVEALLRAEAELARPSAWRLGGWVHRRVGIEDLGRWVPEHRRWPLSARLPRGGREYPGLYGRGDAK
jgi:hypothetical protein